MRPAASKKTPNQLTTASERRRKGNRPLEMSSLGGMERLKDDAMRKVKEGWSSSAASSLLASSPGDVIRNAAAAAVAVPKNAGKGVPRPFVVP